MVSLTGLRLAVGVGILALLGFYTIQRLRGDMSDPSVYLGGGDALVRFSGPSLIAVLVVVLAVLWMDILTIGMMAVLVGLVAYWGFSDWREGA